METSDKRRLRFSEACVCDSDERTVSAQFRDISLDGAYIGTPLPFPVGYKFRLRFAVQGKRLLVTCLVRHTDPGAGMGVQFLSLPPDHKQSLSRHFDHLLERFGETAHAKKRAASRLATRIPATVKGTDAAGKPFEEETETLNISERGACVRLRTPVAPGTTLKVRVDVGPEQHVTDFRVAWVGAPGTHEAGQVGLTPTARELWRAWHLAS